MRALRVKVKFFTTLREMVGKREEEYEFQKRITVEELLRFIVEKYGKMAEDYLFKNGKPKESFSFLINGKSISSQEGLKTELKNGDILAILPPVGGG